MVGTKAGKLRWGVRGVGGGGGVQIVLVKRILTALNYLSASEAFFTCQVVWVF